MKLYVINSCNEWKEYSSFRFIGVVDEKHLQQTTEKIKKKYKYSDDDIDTFIDINEIKLNDLDL